MNKDKINENQIINYIQQEHYAGVKLSPGEKEIIRKTVVRLKEIIQSDTEETCTYDFYGEDANAYKCSECDELWVLNADTPKGNNMNYCPNCGRKIIHK